MILGILKITVSLATIVMQIFLLRDILQAGKHIKRHSTRASDFLNNTPEKPEKRAKENTGEAAVIHNVD